MYLKRKHKYFLTSFIFVFCNLFQVYPQIDSSYIQPFDHDFSAKIYIYDKSAGFDKESNKEEVEYRTNNPVSIGLGIAWKNYSFSFSKGFDIFRDKKRGKTESLEFQHHSYGQKIIYDIFLQQHKGLYNEQPNVEGVYDLHPDVQFSMYGGSFQYIFNNRKFSSRAAFNLNERQIKSAGSFLLGGSVYYSKVQTDSTLLFEQMNKKHKNLQFGASVGYAYTWAISRRWLITAYFSAGATIGNNQPERFFKEEMKIYPTFNGRFAVGYNAKTWSIGTVFMMNTVFLFYDEDQSLSMNNQQLQLTFIKRFHWGNKFVNKTLNQAKDRLKL